MSEIMTVCGPISKNDLGLTSMHDHVLAYLSPYFKESFHESERGKAAIDIHQPIQMENLCYLNELNYRCYSEDNWDLTDVDLMRAEVEFFKQRGGRAILEPSAPGIRTNLNGMRAISEHTGVHIIASTGLYVGVSWPDAFREMRTEAFKDYLLKEIEVGINDTTVKAGHIKTGIRVGTAEEMKFFKTSVEVSNAKNILVTAHTSRSTDPERRREMLHLFLDAGMNPDKLLLCHIHFTFWKGDFVSHFMNPQAGALHLDWAREVMDKGVNICVDLFGEQPGPWDAVRVAGLAVLLKEGYEDKIVIGNDVYQKTMTRSKGGFGYCSMLDYAIPELLKQGVSSTCIHKITVANPMRLLSM